MSHVSCFIQVEIIGFHVLLDSLIHIVGGRPGRLLQFSKRKTVKVFLAFVLTGIEQWGQTGRNPELGQ